MSEFEHVEEHPAFALLREGVPLSLICDLGLAVESAAVYEAEPADTGWLLAASSG